MTDTFRALCAEVLAFNNGEGCYNFSSLKPSDRDNAAFDAWQDIRQRLKSALAQPEPVGRPWPVPGDAEGLAEVFWGNYDQFEPEWSSEIEPVPVAELAQPEPEGPTDQEIADTFAQGCREGAGNPDQPPFLAGARAVLARFGRPAVEPVPVAEQPWEREGLTDEELDHWWAEIDGGPDCCAWRPYARAVIAVDRARWGRPAIKPVPEGWWTVEIGGRSVSLPACRPAIEPVPTSQEIP